MAGNFFLIIALAALIPLLTGFLWYSKALFGNAWMRVNRFRPEDMNGGNMALVFGLVYVFSFLLAIELSAIVIHQFSMAGVVGGSPKSGPDKEWLDNAMKLYGRNFRTFRHGAMHGGIASIFIALPIIGIISLFEKRGWKYVLIHLGYWFITMALMGGVIGQWA